MKQLLMGLAATCMLAGCATDTPTAANEPMAQREYPTGSNIPRKKSAGSEDGVSTYDRDALDRARQQMPQAPRPGLGNTGG